MNSDEREPLLSSSTDERIGRLIRAHHVTQNARHDTNYPVDRGITAWLQVLGGFVIFANSWGVSNAFSVWETYYMDNLMPKQDAAAIAWIGSIQLFFTTIGCLPGGMLLDRGYLKSVIAVGTGLEVLGLILASFFKSNYWAIFFAQGVCTGIGSGLLAIIPVVVLTMFFEKRRMVATGLASTGASVAGLVYPLSMQSLFTSVGFAWAVRIFAFIILVTNTVPLAVIRLRMQCGSKRLSLGFRHFKNLPYTVFVAAFTLLVASSLVPFFFIREYALQLGVSKAMAFNLLGGMYAANIFGRLAPNFIADKYGGTNTLLPLSAACIVTLVLLPLAQTLNFLTAISIVYGFLSGAVLIIPGPTIADLSPSSEEIGVQLGLAYLVASFGGLLGKLLVGQSKGDGKNAVQNFMGVWFCAAAVMVAGVVALFATRWLKLGGPFVVDRI